jgi:hypothetical protein
MNMKKLRTTVALLMLFAPQLFSQEPIYPIFGPHDANGKKFIVQVYYNYIVPPPSSSLDNAN